MSLGADALRKLAALGLNQDQMSGVLDVLASMSDREDARRASQRERTRKFREKIGVTLPLHNSNGYGNSDTSRASVTRVEDNSLPQKIEPQESNKEQVATSAKRDADAFKAELVSDLGTELLDSFVRVRRNKRGALTGFAARLFREDAAKCGMSVTDAARECVRSSWITVKPEYFPGRPRGSPPQRGRTAPIDHFRQFASEINGQERDDGSLGGDRHDAPGLPVRTIEHHRG